MAGATLESGPTRAYLAQAVMLTPKPGLGTQQKEVAEEATVGASEAKEVLAPKPTQVVEKRKTRSHGSAKEL